MCRSGEHEVELWNQLAETVAMPDEGGSNEALDLMLELATLRIKETKITGGDVSNGILCFLFADEAEKG